VGLPAHHGELTRLGPVGLPHVDTVALISLYVLVFISIARVSQIENGDVSTQEVLNRFITALGGTLHQPAAAAAPPFL
jgi:hypothetical protein